MYRINRFSKLANLNFIFFPATSFAPNQLGIVLYLVYSFLGGDETSMTLPVLTDVAVVSLA